MYRWYYNARACYAYLEDCWSPPESHGEPGRSDLSRPYRIQHVILANSRWFTRGWTLQELIAPDDVEFYDGRWNSLGNKRELVTHLCTITGIPEEVLLDRDQLRHTSTAQRMAWSSRRTTSRLEDQAYCLFGLFDVNMPLMYGEGKEAFVRLQEEIISTGSWDDQDHSILGFPSMNGDLLAASPEAFQGCHGLRRTTLAGDGVFEMSKRGLRIRVMGCTLSPESNDRNDADQPSTDLMIMLNCTKGGGKSRVGLRLRARPLVDMSGHPRLDAGRDELVHDRLPDLVDLSTSDPIMFFPVEVTIARKAFIWPRMSRHLVIQQPRNIAIDIGDNYVCHGTACGFSPSCQLQHWTDESGQHVGLGKGRADRLMMDSVEDKKLYAIFEVNLQYTEPGGWEWPEITIQVETDLGTVPPALRAYCSNATTHIRRHYNVREGFPPRLCTLRLGSTRSFNIEPGKDLQLRAGLGFDTGEGVWHLYMEPVFDVANAGPRNTYSSALHAPQPSSSRLAGPGPLLSAPVAPPNIAHTMGVSALQKLLSRLHDPLSVLSLRDNTNPVQRLEKEPYSRHSPPSLFEYGIIASAIKRRIRMEQNVATVGDASASIPSQMSGAYVAVDKPVDIYELEAKPVISPIAAEAAAKAAVAAAVEEELTESVERLYETTSKASPPIRNVTEAGGSSHIEGYFKELVPHMIDSQSE